MKRFAYLASLLCTYLVVAALPTVSAAADAVEPTSLLGSTRWGTRGGARVQSAATLPAGSLVLTLGDDYYASSSMLAPDDNVSQSTQSMSLVWAPIGCLEVGLRQIATVNNYKLGESGTLQVQGNPMLLVKGGSALANGLRLGGALELTVPTSEKGNGLAWDAVVISAQALASYRVYSSIEVLVNAGYVVDRSSNLFRSKPGILPRLVYDVNLVNRFVYGLTVTGAAQLGEYVGVGPYLEFTGAAGPSIESANAPLRATVGARIWPWQKRVVELGVAYEHRLSGGPAVTSPLAGLPPWQLLVQLTLHLLQHDVTTVPTSTCLSDDVCGEHHVCDQGTCAVVRERVVEREVIKEIDTTPPTFTVAGNIVDANTTLPVGNAQIQVDDTETILGSDPNSGKFGPWQLAAGAGLVELKVRASGYIDGKQTMQRGALGESKRVVIKLSPVALGLPGIVKGSIRDGRTGDALGRADIFIPVSRKRVKVNEDGTFELLFKSGHYDLMFTARGYVSQRKDITLRDGDVVIMNIDLLPKPTRRHPQ